MPLVGSWSWSILSFALYYITYLDQVNARKIVYIWWIINHCVSEDIIPTRWMDTVVLNTVSGYSVFIVP